MTEGMNNIELLKQTEEAKHSSLIISSLNSRKFCE